jgi:hypothetical protein
MPDFNKKYATNSYDLLVNAYGDKINVSEDEFYSKIQNDKDGLYRRNVYNLLQNKYGEKVSNVPIDEFTGKFFDGNTDPIDLKEEKKVEKSESESFGLENELDKTQKQLNLIEQGQEAELPPEDYLQNNNVGSGIYRKSKEKELTKKYWKEQKELLEARKKNVERENSLINEIKNLRPEELKAIQETDSKELLGKGYDQNIISYVKKQKYFDNQAEEINSIIDTTTDANYQLSLYNYSKIKDSLGEYDENIDKFLEKSSFNKYNKYEDRVKFLEEEADQYVVKNSKVDSSLDEKEKLRKEFYAKISPYVLFDKDGNPSMFAIQNMSKILDNRIDAQIQALKKELSTLNNEKYNDLTKNRDKYQNIRVLDSKINLAYTDAHKNDSQIRIVADQINDLKRTQDVLSQNVRKPLSKGNLGTGVKDIDWADQATLGIKSMIESVNFLAINKKYNSGQELTATEQSVVDAVGMMNYLQEKSQAGISHKIGQGVAQMPAYMVGFAIGSPLYSGTKTVAKKAVSKAVKKVVIKEADKGLKLATKQLTNWVTHSAVPGAIASVPQTIANPSTSIIKNTATRMTDVAQIALSDDVEDIHANFIEGTGNEFAEALRKGATEAYTENLFERSGTALMQGLGFPIKGITNKVKGTKLYQKLLVGKYAKMKGLSTGSVNFKNTITKVLETAGFNGMVEEMFEEYGTNIANGILNGEDMGFDLETFATTLGTVALWGGGLGTVNKASYSIIGNNVTGTYKDVSGKERKVKIPRKTYDAMLKLKKKEAISVDDIQNLIKDGKLNGKQTSFVQKWWMGQIMNGYLESAKEENKTEPKKEKKPEVKKEEKKKRRKKDYCK